jgi:hypothetical protein
MGLTWSISTIPGDHRVRKQPGNAEIRAGRDQQTQDLATSWQLDESG